MPFSNASAAQIKRVRALHQKKYRQAGQEFIVEGVRTVREALRVPARIRLILVTEPFLSESSSLFETMDPAMLESSVRLVSEDRMKALSGTQTPSGILAVCSIVPGDPDRDGNWLYLDEVRDPGNAGTLLRTAAWFDVRNIGFGTADIDPWNTKVARSGMGAHFDLNIVTGFSLSGLKSRGYQILGAAMDGEPVHRFNKLKNPWALALGGEADGITTATASLVDHWIAIPRSGTGESLNVAIAGGILLYELCGR